MEPPRERDEESVVGRVNGEPLRAGFKVEEDVGESESYFKFRSGQYDLEVKIDFDVGRGQARISLADGYEGQ